MTFGTLLSSQGTDASIETLPGSSGRFPSCVSSLSDPLTAFPTPAGGALHSFLRPFGAFRLYQISPTVFHASRPAISNRSGNSRIGLPTSGVGYPEAVRASCAPGSLYRQLGEH
ncbi:hypothetical protein C7M71_022065 [Peterkaempfera bronchialis]|uniref:Uncharacterized protein n=1 Tax=Peterkaempfera bronchialis TaxID=2126346 RepID=A0A345T135_9ACTN|nr:hypothetical protein C7M71_022065 [Peterkaempfera bronchialis]